MTKDQKLKELIEKKKYMSIVGIGNKEQLVVIIINSTIMEQNEFVANFADQFDDTDASDIHAFTVFRDLEEWSSLTSMSVIALAKTEYGKSITGTELKACVTVLDVFNLINNK